MDASVTHAKIKVINTILRHVNFKNDLQHLKFKRLVLLLHLCVDLDLFALIIND